MISVVQLGTVDYATGLRLQQQLVALRKEEKIGDVLLLLEHKPVITLGRNAKATNVIASAELLEQHCVDVFECDRGGDVTFHGPGQVVGYPIFDLRGFCLGADAEACPERSRRVRPEESKTRPHAVEIARQSEGNHDREGHDFSRADRNAQKEPASAAGVSPRKHIGVIDFVRRLEEVLIRTCADFHIQTKRVPGLTGVWTDPDSLLSKDKLKGLSFRAPENDSKNRSLESRNLLSAGTTTNLRGESIREGRDFSRAVKSQEKESASAAGGREAKLAAIGVHISRFVTSHGFALNVNPELSYFNLIIPCGITSKPVTSMQKELGRQLDLNAVAESISRNFGTVFQSEILWLDSLDALLEKCGAGVPARECR